MLRWTILVVLEDMTHRLEAIVTGTGTQKSHDITIRHPGRDQTDTRIECIGVHTKKPKYVWVVELFPDQGFVAQVL